MNGLQLIATGGALPGRTVTNEDLSRVVDTSDEWITTRTGIRTRHWCTEGESAATLAITAARQALERSGLAPEQIACCVCATLSAPDATPSVACQVQRAHHTGRAVCAGGRVRGPFPSDGPNRPLYLCPLWRWRGRGRLRAGRYSFRHHAGSPGQ